MRRRKPKLKQRRSKRDVAPQFQFLTATNPSQCKEEHARKSIRSQAMIHFRQSEDGRTRSMSRLSSVDTSDTPSVVGPVPDEPSVVQERPRPTQAEVSSAPDISWRADHSSSWKLAASAHESKVLQHLDVAEAGDDPGFA